MTFATSIFAADGVSRMAPFNGMQVHYESYGEGNEALVFIHGWTCDLTFWRGQAPVYTAHRSLLIDLPGHGASGKPFIPYPSDLFARSIEAVMRDAGVDRAVLIGHSLGGPIAHAFIRQFPEKVKAMVLVDAYITPPSEPRGSVGKQQQQAQAQRTRLGQRAANLKGEAGRRNFEREVNAMFSPRTTVEMRAEILRKMTATPEHVRAAAVTSISGLPPAKPGDVFDVPAIAMQAASTGVEDRYRAMRTMYPQLKLDVWTGYGHFLMMEDPERFNRSLESFLAGLQ